MSILNIETYGYNETPTLRGLASALLHMRHADIEKLAVRIDAARRDEDGKSDAALKGRHLIEAAQEITGIRVPPAAPEISRVRKEPL